MPGWEMPGRACSRWSSSASRRWSSCRLLYNGRSCEPLYGSIIPSQVHASWTACATNSFRVRCKGMLVCTPAQVLRPQQHFGALRPAGIPHQTASSMQVWRPVTCSRHCWQATTHASQAVPVSYHLLPLCAFCAMLHDHLTCAAKPPCLGPLHIVSFYRQTGLS